MMKLPWPQNVLLNLLIYLINSPIGSKPSCIFNWIVAGNLSSKHVDPTTRNFLSHKIESVCKGGRAVLLTTNSIDEVNAMCSRVGFLVAGEMSCIGSFQSVRSEVTHINVLRVKLKSKPEE